MSLKILVTGGSGYIGSILVPELLEAGHQVTVADNFLYGQASLSHVCNNSRLDIKNIDVRLESEIYPLIKKSDVIIPLAALVGAPICARDPIGAHSINHEAVTLMLRLAAKGQIVLMPTTNSAYGSGDGDRFCDETSPLNPISKYAVDKVEVEQRLMEHENAVSFRLATVFGMSPRMRLDLLVNDFTYRAVNDRFIVLFEGHFKRNYIHVRDVSRVFLHALDNIHNMRGEIYNVGLSDANLSKLELCELIAHHVDGFYYKEAPVGKDPDQRDYIVSNSKIECTGFLPRFSVDDGIKELIKGYIFLKNRRYGNI